jgi:quinol-cytochrome oxidoreductase complex cytochrome b subunit/mono/diheme cytochrome c family protein
LLERLSDWFDNRTGYRALLHEALDEPIPGGARWRYVFGSALTATFFIQLATGLLLMCSYSPSSTTAWGSVFYINEVMTLGWFVRGIHHFGSQAMVVLLAMHLIQVLLAGAYRAPREVNWWFGMALLFATLGFSLTGYLLPWDQKGYWATKVATNIAGGAPGLGPYIQKVVVGGTDYGNQTLTRFYGLHVGVLPMVLILCLVAHVALFRKHGVTAPSSTRPTEKFWPRQVFMDTVASGLVLAVLVGLVLTFRGADLDAPADPGRSDYPARPEWYFLSLFQMLKLFPGKREVIGTIVVPTAILVVLLALPLLDKLFPRRLAHVLAVMVVFSLVGGAGYLTVAAIREDAANWEFQAARHRADEARRRALQLAADPRVGIPPEGPSYLLPRDAYYNGHRVLEAKCLSCHYYGGEGMVSTVVSKVTPADLAHAEAPPAIKDVPPAIAAALAAKAKGFRPTSVDKGPGRGERLLYTFKGEGAQGERAEAVVAGDGSKVELTTHSKQTAADLKGFGGYAWVRGLLDDPRAPTYFGHVPQNKGMKRWKAKSKLSAKQLDDAASFVAKVLSAQPRERTLEELEADEQAKAHPGLATFRAECAKCHNLGADEGEAPNLSGWGSRPWLARMIEHPDSPDLYGFLDKADQMPSFADRLAPNDLNTLIDYLHGQYLPPKPEGPAAPAGAAIAGK